MYLTEKHIIKRTHPLYNECDKLCFQSKNIYNQGLYNVRKHYFNTKAYLNYYGNYDLTKTQECYDYLPKKVFTQTLKHVDMVFKSFFALLKNKTVKKLSKLFDKNKFIVKITPIHETHSAIENGFEVSGYADYDVYRQFEQPLLDEGWDVIVFVPSKEEDEDRITCGNALLSETFKK